MTKRLQEAFSAAQKLSADAQDALAHRILADLHDEQSWDHSFEQTSDEQWDRLADKVQTEIASGETETLEDFLK